MSKYEKTPTEASEEDNQTKLRNKTILNTLIMNKQNNKIEVKIIETKRDIIFIDKSNSKVIRLQIPKLILDSTFLECEEIHSIWVSQLLKMEWATNELLYQLAVIIQRQHPTCNINWYFQFIEIECDEYNNQEYLRKTPNLRANLSFLDLPMALKILMPDKNEIYMSNIFKVLEDKLDFYELYPCGIPS